MTTDPTTTSRAPAAGRARVERYNPTEIEPRWQARWEELGLTGRTCATRRGRSTTC